MPDSDYRAYYENQVDKYKFAEDDTDSQFEVNDSAKEPQSDSETKVDIVKPIKQEADHEAEKIDPDIVDEVKKVDPDVIDEAEKIEPDIADAEEKSQDPASSSSYSWRQKKDNMSPARRRIRGKRRRTPHLPIRISAVEEL